MGRKMHFNLHNSIWVEKTQVQYRTSNNEDSMKTTLTLCNEWWSKHSCTDLWLCFVFVEWDSIASIITDIYCHKQGNFKSAPCGLKLFYLLQEECLRQVLWSTTDLSLPLLTWVISPYIAIDIYHPFFGTMALLW